MDEFKHGKLVVFGVDAQSEEKSRVAPIHDLVVPILHTVPHTYTDNTISMMNEMPKKLIAERRASAPKFLVSS